MKHRSHKCGGCQSFLKVKGNWGNSGLCAFFDRRTNDGYGNGCKAWKAIPYERKKFVAGRENWQG